MNDVRPMGLDEIVFCLTTAGVLPDAKRAAASYEYGALKFIVRAAAEVPLKESKWLTFGLLDDLGALLRGGD